MTYMPNTIFSCQTTLKKDKFLELGLKNANLATLALSCHTRNRFMLTNLACPIGRLRGGMGIYYGTEITPQTNWESWHRRLKRCF